MDCKRLTGFDVSSFDIDTLPDLVVPLSAYPIEKMFEVFKYSFEHKKEQCSFLDGILLQISLSTGNEEKINALLNIVDYVRKSGFAVMKIIIWLRFSKNNRDNIDTLYKMFRDKGIYTYGFNSSAYEDIDRNNDFNAPVFVLPESSFSDLEKHYNCVYIHLAKNAGTSLNEYLNLDEFFRHTHHKSALECRNADEEKFRKFFKFAIVRNPWDRLVSQYFYCQKRVKSCCLPQDTSIHFLYRCKTFREAVFELKRGFTPPSQYTEICDEQGNIIVDYVGRFENIEESFKYIGKKLGIDPNKPIPHTNKSKHTKYTDYYDEEMVEIVRRAYKTDVELFGYEFDKSPGANIIINSRDDLDIAVPLEINCAKEAETAGNSTFSDF